MPFSVIRCIAVFVISVVLCAQTVPAEDQENWPLLIGTNDGLYGLDRSGHLVNLRTGGQVRKIMRAGSSWAILGSEGILVSQDLRHWESRNSGLPVKTIKIYEGGRKSFISTVQEIKDFEINPADPEIFVCATNDTVYLSRNSGFSWVSLGTPPYRTNGIKAVASAYMPTGNVSEFTVFLSHSTYGIHYIIPGTAGAKWTELNAGLEKIETTNNADEAADIAVVQSTINSPAEIYASQTFRGRIYRLDWANKRFITRWSDNAPFGTADSLDPGRTGLRFVREGMVSELSYQNSNTVRDREDLRWIIEDIPKNLKLQPNCVIIQNSNTNGAQEVISLSELWLFAEGASKAAKAAIQRITLKGMIPL